MTKFTMGEAAEGGDQKEFSVIPENTVLLAELTDCSVVESPFDDEKNPGQKKMQVSFKWKVIQEGPHEGRILFGNTSTAFVAHPDCKLRAWVLEILGQDDLPVGFNFDTDNLVGAIANVGVTNYPSSKLDTQGNKIIKDRVGWVRRASDADFLPADEAF